MQSQPWCPGWVSRASRSCTSARGLLAGGITCVADIHPSRCCSPSCRSPFLPCRHIYICSRQIYILFIIYIKFFLRSFVSIIFHPELWLTAGSPFTSHRSDPRVGLLANLSPSLFFRLLWETPDHSHAAGPNAWVLGSALPGCVGACTLTSHPAFLTPVPAQANIPSTVEGGKQHGACILSIFIYCFALGLKAC